MGVVVKKIAHFGLSQVSGVCALGRRLGIMLWWRLQVFGVDGLVRRKCPHCGKDIEIVVCGWEVSSESTTLDVDVRKWARSKWVKKRGEI